jgi:hypothetical protein
MKNLWWGYQRCNDTFQINRYYGESELNVARGQWDIVSVIGPFEAKDWQTAIDYVVSELG